MKKIVDRTLTTLPFMRKRKGYGLLPLFFLLFSISSFSQVSSLYTWTYATGAHVAMAGGTTLASTTAMDDAIFTNIPIGFTYNFNGIDYTTVGVSTNGFIWFGTTSPATTEYTPISSATAMDGVVSGFGANLVGRAAGATLKYTTTGTCPNRVFMVQWFNMKIVGKSSQLDIQITLTEGSNQAEVHPYDSPYFVADKFTGQVGLRGNSNADFKNRSVISCTNAWNSSVAGATNAVTCQIDGITCSTYPAANARYRFTNGSSISTVTWNGSMDNDWFNAANWTPAIVPTSYNNVSIPASLAMYPVLSGSTNTFCKSLALAAGASLTTASGYTGVLTVMNNLANNGTIVNNGTNYINLTSTAACTISGTGDFTNCDLGLTGSCTNYSLSNDIVIRKLSIGTGATLSMNTFNLKVCTTFTQTGTINQSTGTLQIEDVAPTLTNATFNEQTGLTYFATGITTTAANQLIPSITYYNLKINTNNGFTTTIGTGSTTTCNNLVVANPGAAGGIALAANAISVNGNFDLAPAGTAPVFNLNSNVTIAGISTLYLGIINTGTNKVIVTNSAAAAMVAGAGNTNYTLSYINGNLRRMIASGLTGNYDFPLGDASTSRYAVLLDNGLSGGGFTFLDSYFGALANHTDVDMVATEPTEAGVTYTHMAPEGVWFIDPDNQPAAGTYDIQLSINGFAGLADDQFAILKRISTSVTGADWTNGGPTPTRPASMLPGRTLASGYALRYGLSSFSQFGIATPTIVPLPIELLLFTAAVNGKDVDLNWKTATEVNNDFFTVERSADAMDFGFVDEVKGAGNSNQPINYFTKDNNPLPGTSYYRLKQTDFDGHYKYSNVVPVNIVSKDFELVNTYTNSAAGVLEITLNNNSNYLIKFDLYTSIGEKKYSLATQINGQNVKVELPCATLAKGIYLLRVSGGNQLISRKIKL
ncbi:MAG: hypothetical protein JWP12_2632 [Bacteroidetes bacterium]|nr:hypothetical protein [Bacteroidota bacterium]